MGNFFRSLTDPGTLTGLIFISILLNVVGVYLVRRLDGVLGFVSKRWRNVTSRREARIVVQVATMLANTQLAVEFKIDMLTAYVRFVTSLVIAMFCVLIIGLNIPDMLAFGTGILPKYINDYLLSIFAFVGLITALSETSRLFAMHSVLFRYSLGKLEQDDNTT
jgi:hypothetical protein